MLNNTEAFLANKKLYSFTNIDIITKVILSTGLKGINLHGGHLENYSKLAEHTNLFVNIDYPFSQMDTGGRLALLEYYMQTYGQLISGFNVGPLLTPLLDNKWKSIAHDLKTIASFCKDVLVESRFLLNLISFKNTEECIRIANLVEQAGFDSLIIGSSLYRIKGLSDSLIDTYVIKKNVSMPVGVFGNIKTKEQLESIENGKFSPILLLPENIVSLWEQ